MNLYRTSTRRTSLATLLLAAALSLLAAQRSQHKLRATALVELTTDSHGIKVAQVIPITILDSGIFRDASIYKAMPEPMALQSGVVYEAEKNGQPVGFVTISNAVRDVKGDTWTAYGRWQPMRAKPKSSPSATPASNPADERPILHRSGTPSASPQSSASPAPSPAATPATTDSDRPVLHRSADQASPTPSPNPEATTAQQPLPEDPNRPTLRRGKPQEAAGEPQPSAPVHAPANAKIAKGGPSAPAQVYVAISDAQPEDARSFQFLWKPGEEAPIDEKSRRLAAAQLSKAIGTTVSERELKNVVVRTFDLDLTNDAVVVLSAELPPGAAPARSSVRAKTHSPASATASGSPARPTHYITIIARVDFDGDPQYLAGSVTDSSRLDVAPRLELVDAVDVDGDGIGELLFRQYSFDDTNFVIYGIRHGSVSKIFEGASIARQQ